MNTAVQMQEARIKDISVTKDTIMAQLMDGRTISVPLAWSWRLLAHDVRRIGESLRLLPDGCLLADSRGANKSLKRLSRVCM